MGHVPLGAEGALPPPVGALDGVISFGYCAVTRRSIGAIDRCRRIISAKKVNKSIDRRLSQKARRKSVHGPKGAPGTGGALWTAPFR